MEPQIRKIEACQAWDLRHKVMWPGKDIDYVKLADDASGIHYGLFENDRLASVISLFVAGDAVQFRKFATAIDRQQQGFGTRLLRYVLKETEKLGAKKIWCNARRNAAGFYRKLGFRETGEPFERDGVEYVRMTRDLAEAEGR